VAKTAGRKRGYDEVGNPPKLLAHPWINESLSRKELFEKYGNDATFQQYMFGLYVKDKVCIACAVVIYCCLLCPFSCTK